MKHLCVAFSDLSVLSQKASIVGKARKADFRDRVVLLRSMRYLQLRPPKWLNSMAPCSIDDVSAIRQAKSVLIGIKALQAPELGTGRDGIGPLWTHVAEGALLQIALI